MNCPVCGKTMVEEDCGGVIVDVCKRGCKGIWFDWLELTKLDENNEGVGSALAEALNHPRMSDQSRGKVKCPKCGKSMYTHKHKMAKEVTVDECVSCGGIFLDSGELKVVRDNFMTPDEADEYMQRLLAEVPGYAKKLDDIKRKEARNEAIARFTRFLRVSYYLTGK